ncbi:UDP-N-acetylmuramate dehydrogenase [Candidatus Parcubacteria bacterium]|nr:UDP-N-acetylmuramate dehydrogenase [Patescibacteria group bacterium]MBU4309087.1 UDP-N-acetylmuramate dehydrogenase [Patescibacteria group bacterium]MBU4432464.1 UDP-N-acetylmuramate dehydrogenase [Patescibacteria group bacterium]MBU4577448.1 UDP-N-acetylmuramate dehydrogenase [Patescibacteria group bacterium]MCG2697136.1 UDP-N-acetylmuramate dehydrogenase [Candidatus Parcubacteria bacterium]
MNIQENIKLNNYTTFKIGGIARFYVEVGDDTELKDVFAWIEAEKLKWLILAGGSNVLFNDDVFDGVVIRLQNNDLIMRGDRLECGAGASLSKAVTMATKESLSGLEWAAGIPGSIGGAVRGNAGAFGGQIADTVEIVEVFNLEKNKMEILSSKDCLFAYRDSIFKEEERKYIIWKIFLKLKKGEQGEIQELVGKYIEHRGKTQPRLPSAGSVFKNFDADFIKAENIDLYETATEKGIIKNNKIAAGWVIDQLDLRGKKIGGAKISLEHANFIVNTGDASAKDVITLISFVKQKVRDKYKIQLHEEIQYLGF